MLRLSGESGAQSVPGGGDRGGPAPGGVDAQAELSGAAGDSGGDVQDSVAEGVDLAAGQLWGVGEGDELGPGDQVGGGQDDFEPGGVGLENVAGQVGQAGGFGLADAVLDAGVLAVAQFQSGQLPRHSAGGGIGDEGGDAHAVDVGEAQLRPRMGPLFAQQQSGPGRPGGQVDQGGGFGHPRPVTDLSIGVDGGVPAFGEVEGVHGVPDPGVDGKPEGESDPTIAARLGEAMGGPGRVAAHHHRRSAVRAGLRAPIGGQRGQRLLEDADVVCGGVGAGIALAQQSGQGFPAADLWAVQKRQQRMVAEGLLPRRGGVLLVVGMVDDQRGIDVDVERSATGGGGSGGPGRRPRGCSGVADLRQVGGVDAVGDQPPHRGRGGLGPEHVLAVPAELADSVDAVRPVGDRCGQIGEHRTGGIGPLPFVGIG